jgi:hypothetical protein
MASHPSWTSTYRSRAGLPTTGPLASYLLSLVAVKQTNLCLSADVETSAELLQLAEDVGDYICVFKTHCDIVTDWTDRTAHALRGIAQRKRFLIFEDRKFADIGGTSLPESACLWPCPPSSRVPQLDREALTQRHRNGPEAVHVRPLPHRTVG